MRLLTHTCFAYPAHACAQAHLLVHTLHMRLLTHTCLRAPCTCACSHTCLRTPCTCVCSLTPARAHPAHACAHSLLLACTLHMRVLTRTCLRTPCTCACSPAPACVRAGAPEHPGHPYRQVDPPAEPQPAPGAGRALQRLLRSGPESAVRGGGAGCAAAEVCVHKCVCVCASVCVCVCVCVTLLCKGTGTYQHTCALFCVRVNACVVKGMHVHACVSIRIRACKRASVLEAHPSRARRREGHQRANHQSFPTKPPHSITPNNRQPRYCPVRHQSQCLPARPPPPRARVRRYPQIYESNQRLVVDPASVRVERQDFFAAAASITPASHRRVWMGLRPVCVERVWVRLHPVCWMEVLPMAVRRQPGKPPTMRAAWDGGTRPACRRRVARTRRKGFGGWWVLSGEACTGTGSPRLYKPLRLMQAYAVPPVLSVLQADMRP